MRRLGRFGISVEERDGILSRFGNQLAAVGEGQARVAMGRALNRAGRTISSRLKRNLVKQTSIKRKVLDKVVKTRLSAHKGDGPLEFVIYATGSELPLRDFGPKQFSWGVRARVWGRQSRFPSAFIFAGSYKSKNPVGNGHVFHRVGGTSYPIERMVGPSIPTEMLLPPTVDDFEADAAELVQRRLAHELGRMLG